MQTRAWRSSCLLGTIEDVHISCQGQQRDLQAFTAQGGSTTCREPDVDVPSTTLSAASRSLHGKAAARWPEPSCTMQVSAS
jgi:hypothetical protein